jgi:xylan 1,4-beta-xylosidase
MSIVSNCCIRFWTGSQADYFHLYNITAVAIKSVDKRIQVGGPATAGSGWIPEMLNYVKRNNVPLDFISTHEYPTDTPPDERNQLQKVTTKIRKIVGDIPLYYTEWNCGLGDFGQGTLLYQDSSYAAPCIVSNIARVQGNVDIFSYWTFSDIFEEQGISSVPHHAAFGMMTIYGTRKAAWRAFELLHKAGDRLLQVTGADPTVDVMATLDANNRIMIFASNYDVLNKTVVDKTLRITVYGQAPTQQATLSRVDRQNANAYESWVEMGSPVYPTKQQLSELEKRSQIVTTPISFQKITSNEYAFDVVVPAYGLAVISYNL